MINKKTILIFMYIFIIINTGCWDRTPIDELALIKLVYVNRPENSNLLEIILFRPFFEPNKDVFANVILEKGNNFYNAFNNIQQKESKRIVFGMVELTIIGDSLAKKGINDVFTEIDTNTYFNRKSKVIVQMNPAKDLFEFAPPEQKRTAVLIKNVVNHVFEINFTPQLNISKIKEKLLNKDQGFVLPAVSMDMKENDVTVEGLAVFKEDTWIDFLNIKESKLYMIIADKISELPLEFSNEELKDSDYKFINITMVNKDIDYTINIQDNIPHISLTINIDVNLENYILLDGRNKNNQNGLDKNRIKDLQKTLSKSLEIQLNGLVKKAQDNFQADIFEFSEKVRVKQNAYFKKCNWSNVFPKSNISIKVNFNLRKIGHSNYME